MALVGGFPASALAAPSTTTPATTTPATTTPATTTPATVTAALVAERLLASAISAANSEPALDWTSSANGGGELTTEVTEAGRFDGTQTIVSGRGALRAQLDLVLIGKTIYAMGNKVGLGSLVGLSPVMSEKLAGKWISVPASAGNVFRSMADGLTVSSTTAQLDMVGTLTPLAETMVQHRSALGVRGTSMSTGLPLTETIYMRSGPVALPVEIVASSDGVTQSVVFGPWGKPPAAKAPKSSLAFERGWLA